jgi:hypothetical protein
LRLSFARGSNKQTPLKEGPKALNQTAPNQSGSRVGDKSCLARKVDS